MLLGTLVPHTALKMGQCLQNGRPTSESTTVRKTVKGSHIYTIKGYSLFKGMGPGNFISSDVFTIGGHQWTAVFYPDGNNAQDKSMYVSAFLNLVDNGKDVAAWVGLTLLDQSGKDQHKVCLYMNTYGSCTFGKKVSSWGLQKLYQRSELENSVYLKDDCLKIEFSVGVVTDTRNERPKKFCINVPPSNIGQSLKEFLDSGIAWDILFVVNGEVFHAHKYILAARSPVFRAQLFGPTGDTTIDKIVVKKIAPPIFKAMLQFIYSDSLPDFDELKRKASCCSSIELVLHLLYAADRYGLDRLSLLCEAKLISEITADNVATTLAVAEEHKCHQLKSLCLEFAALPTNLEGVTKSEGYEQLKESFPSLVCELLQKVASNAALLGS